MTDTTPIPNTPKARKKPEYDPWKILCAEITKVAAEHDEAMRAEYASLADCESACRKLALANVGVTFTPVKYGKPCTAGKVEKVALL